MASAVATVVMPDFTETELEDIQSILENRYKESVETFLADCEIQPDRDNNEIVECPALFWHARNCNFVVVKISDDQFRGQFFYHPEEHFGGDQPEYTNAVNCTLALLQSQSDHEREQHGVRSGITGSDLA